MQRQRLRYKCYEFETYLVFVCNGLEFDGLECNVALFYNMKLFLFVINL